MGALALREGALKLLNRIGWVVSHGRRRGHTPQSLTTILSPPLRIDTQSLVGNDFSDDELHAMLSDMDPDLTLKHSEQIQFDEFVTIVNSVRNAAARKLSSDGDDGALATEDVPLMVDGEEGTGLKTPVKKRTSIKINFDE